LISDANTVFEIVGQRAMTDIREQVFAKAVESGGRLTVRSALNPVLWLCAIISVPAVVVSGFKETPQMWLILFAFAPVFAALVGFFFLLLVDRDKLQSEDYQIKKRSLELMQQKGDAGPTILDVHETSRAVENPQLPQLPPEGK
jgi:hypothetical protein